MHAIKYHFHSCETESYETVNWEHFNTVNKICACRKHVNFTYKISYIYIFHINHGSKCTHFVLNFVFYSVTFVGILYFLKITNDI